MLEGLRICAPDPWIVLSLHAKDSRFHFDRGFEVFCGPCWLGLFHGPTVTIVEMELHVPQISHNAERLPGQHGRGAIYGFAYFAGDLCGPLSYGWQLQDQSS